MQRLFGVRDDTRFHQVHHPVGEHLGVNAQVVLVGQRQQQRLGDGTDAQLQGGTVVDE